MMAATQPMAVHESPLAQRVSGALRSICGVAPGDRLLLGVSGGADSMALLRVLDALARQRHWALDVHAAHVNHKLRAEADDDERYVRQVCGELGVPCHVHGLASGSLTGNVEAAARRARYAALAAIARDIDADAVVTAHHADDQLETLLMRLLRGSSLRGLTGIAPRRTFHGVTIVRPMLDADHAMAVDLLTRLGQPWREDRTNVDVSRLRARLRAEVTPVLRAIRPDAAGKAADTARQLHEAARHFEHMVERARRRCMTASAPDEVTLDRGAAKRLPVILLGEVLRSLAVRLGAQGDALGRNVITPMVAAVQGDSGHTRTFDLSGAVRVVVGRGAVVLSRRG